MAEDPGRQALLFFDQGVGAVPGEPPLGFRCQEPSFGSDAEVREHLFEGKLLEIGGGTGAAHGGGSGKRQGGCGHAPTLYLPASEHQ
ncbi:MAG: hypothetical protein ACHBNF_12870 [Chromatiales bacterium]